MRARPTAAVRIALVLASGCGLDEVEVTELGDAPMCADLSIWPAESAREEEELAALVGDLRGRGTECGGEQVKGVGPVEHVPALRCAARRLAGDLARGETLEHDGTDDSTPLSRVNLSGYEGITRHELLAADYIAAEDTIAAFTAEERHCRFLMDKNLDHVGVGHAESPERDRIVWVLVTGEERE